MPGSRLLDSMHRMGFWFLDITTRSWIALWGTIAACGLYAAWNRYSGVIFDPYPFIFLTLILTFFSYLQNIIIMTVQRANDEAQARQEALQHKQLEYMMHLMTAIRDQLAKEAGHEKDRGS